MQGGRGQWAVYYTSPQSFIILIRWLNNFGDLSQILIGWFSKLSFHMFRPLIVVYRRCNLSPH